MTTEHYRLSFCTTAMGRLDHVRQTLLRNIEDNADYPDAEFVLLDYGSKDGLGDWVRDNAGRLLESGRLVYLRVDGVEYYSHSHSKNVCFLASTGTAMCTIDADNFMPRGFAFHLNDLLHTHPRAVAAGRTRGVTGRITMFRNDLLAVGGYNESLRGWGYDDKDLRGRLLAAGCQIQWFNHMYAKAIQHGSDRRVENMPPGHRKMGRSNHANRRVHRRSIAQGQIVANAGTTWGEATIYRNFSQTLTTGVVQAARLPVPFNLDWTTNSATNMEVANAVPLDSTTDR
jgi:hypothetical protein